MLKRPNQGEFTGNKKRFVTSNTSGTYNDKIIILMMWIFDTRREFIVQDYRTELEAMNHEDLPDFQRREEYENVTNRRKRNPSNKRTGIQKMTRQLVDEIQPSISGIINKIPIKIDIEGNITYKVVQD